MPPQPFSYNCIKIKRDRPFPWVESTGFFACLQRQSALASDGDPLWSPIGFPPGLQYSLYLKGFFFLCLLVFSVNCCVVPVQYMSLVAYKYTVGNLGCLLQDEEKEILLGCPVINSRSPGTSQLGHLTQSSRHLAFIMDGVFSVTAKLAQ